MEINKYEEILGVMPTANVVEGRFGVLTSHSTSYDFGSGSDLPGFKVPATAEEANNARYVITWAVDNRPYPTVAFSNTSPTLRYGFETSDNVPAQVTFYATPPSVQEGLTIPAGTPALAFGKGVYTIPSGGYIYNAGLVNPGALVQVANTAEDSTDAGKLKYLATYSSRKVGTVRFFDSTTGKLTVEID